MSLDTMNDANEKTTVDTKWYKVPGTHCSTSWKIHKIIERYWQKMNHAWRVLLWHWFDESPTQVCRPENLGWSGLYLRIPFASTLHAGSSPFTVPNEYTTGSTHTHSCFVKAWRCTSWRWWPSRQKLQHQGKSIASYPCNWSNLTGIKFFPAHCKPMRTFFTTLCLKYNVVFSIMPLWLFADDSQFFFHFQFWTNGQSQQNHFSHFHFLMDAFLRKRKSPDQAVPDRRKDFYKWCSFQSHMNLPQEVENIVWCYAFPVSFFSSEKHSNELNKLSWSERSCRNALIQMMTEERKHDKILCCRNQIHDCGFTLMVLSSHSRQLFVGECFPMAGLWTFTTLLVPSHWLFSNSWKLAWYGEVATF